MMQIYVIEDYIFPLAELLKKILFNYGVLFHRNGVVKDKCIQPQPVRA